VDPPRARIFGEAAQISDAAARRAARSAWHLRGGRTFPAGSSGLGLEIEDQTQSFVDLLEEGARKRADMLDQESLIDGDDLGNIGHAVLGQACPAAWNQDVSGGVRTPEIRGQDNRDHRPDQTLVEAVALDNDDGAPVAWRGAQGLGQLGPPDISPLDYHSSGGREADWIAETTGSSSELSSL
jgi:hypothetical protein